MTGQVDSVTLEEGLVPCVYVGCGEENKRKEAKHFALSQLLCNNGRGTKTVVINRMFTWPGQQQQRRTTTSN